MNMKTVKPYQLDPVSEGAIFHSFSDADGQPIGKLYAQADGYEDNRETVLNAPVYKDLLERVFAFALVHLETDDPAWASLKREAMEALG